MNQPAPAITIKQPDGTERVLYEPTPMALRVATSNTPYLLMLGARGTGKSTILRWLAHALCLAHPGYRALIVRNTYPALRRSHLVNIRGEMAAFGGDYHDGEKVARYPNGSKCWFGAVDDDAAVQSFLSSEFYLLVIDEAVTIPLDTFLALDACVRVPESMGVLPLRRLASNTLGPHARWVKRWFVDKTVSAEESEHYDPRDFETIESLLADNPHIDADAYRKSLGHQPEHVRRSWIHNEWVLEGNYFEDFRPTLLDEDSGARRPWHVIDELPTIKGRSLLDQPWIAIYRVVDWGFSPDPAVCLWIAVLPNGRAIVFKERTWHKTTAADVAKAIVRESAGMRVVETYCDPSMFASSGHTGVSIGDYFELNRVPLTPSRNDRAAIGAAIHEFLNTTIDQEPKLQIHGTACPNLVQTLPEMQIDKRDASKIAAGNDHWVIALGYFCQGDVAASRDPERPTVPFWMQTATKRARLGAESARRIA